MMVSPSFSLPALSASGKKYWCKQLVTQLFLWVFHLHANEELMIIPSCSFVYPHACSLHPSNRSEWNLKEWLLNNRDLMILIQLQNHLTSYFLVQDLLCFCFCFFFLVWQNNISRGMAFIGKDDISSSELAQAPCYRSSFIHLFWRNISSHGFHFFVFSECYVYNGLTPFLSLLSSLRMNSLHNEFSIQL